MNNCNNGHELIKHESVKCPICAIQEEINDINSTIRFYSLKVKTLSEKKQKLLYDILYGNEELQGEKNDGTKTITDD